MQVGSLEHSYFHVNKLMEEQRKQIEAERTHCIAQENGLLNLPFCCGGVLLEAWNVLLFNLTQRKTLSIVH